MWRERVPTRRAHFCQTSHPELQTSSPPPRNPSAPSAGRRLRFGHSRRPPVMPVRLVSQEELPHPLNGYRLIERLGRGGFGEVWKIEAPGGMLKAAKFV